jgi:hemin uptake protein HemP
MRNHADHPGTKPVEAREASPLPQIKPRVDSDHLFQGNSEIVIVHRKEEYHLRITRNGKLILTK